MWRRELFLSPPYKNQKNVAQEISNKALQEHAPLFSFKKKWSS